MQSTLTEDLDLKMQMGNNPGDAPRPVAPELKMRSFDIPQTAATHLRVELVTNQCQGGPKFQGEQDNDPVNPTDCATASEAGTELRAAELQVFSANVR